MSKSLTYPDAAPEGTQSCTLAGRHADPKHLEMVHTGHSYPEPDLRLQPLCAACTYKYPTKFSAIPQALLPHLIPPGTLLQQRR